MKGILFAMLGAFVSALWWRLWNPWPWRRK
jgi:hypothetical protein